jgi:hypothetical protein
MHALFQRRRGGGLLIKIQTILKDNGASAILVLQNFRTTQLPLANTTTYVHSNNFQALHAWKIFNEMIIIFKSITVIFTRVRASWAGSSSCQQADCSATQPSFLPSGIHFMPIIFYKFNSFYMTSSVMLLPTLLFQLNNFNYFVCMCDWMTEHCLIQPHIRSQPPTPSVPGIHHKIACITTVRLFVSF